MLTGVITKRLVYGVLVLALALVTVLGCAKPQKQVIRIYDGPPTGGWIPIVNFMKLLIEESSPEILVAIEAGGGASNVIAVSEGQGEFGMTSTPSHYDGWEGKPPFEKPMQNIRQVFNILQFATLIIVQDPSIRSVSDLKGKRVGVMPRGYTQETVNQRVLALYGLSYDDIKPEFLGQPDSMSAFRDGRLDAVMFPTEMPKDARILEVAQVRSLAFLSLEEDKIKVFQAQNKGMPRVVIPKGTYPKVDYDTVTVAIRTSLIANKDVPDDIVEKVTRALVEGLPEWKKNYLPMEGTTPETAAGDIGIPYHPGALKYYKSIGVIK